MERNDVSFSIPTWRREQIKSIQLAEEEKLYSASPYNLNDFKNGQHSVEYIFAPSEEPSDIKSFVAKRQLNPKVNKEVGLFTIVLYQIILHENNLGSNDRLPATEKNLETQRSNTKLLGILKQKIMELNLCKLKDIPKQFEKYYQNPIIKKILFQYFGKCVYNISLIQILLTNNDFLRFSVQLFIRAILLQGNLLSKYTDYIEFNEQVETIFNYFSYLFMENHKQQGSMKDLDKKSKKMFSYEPNTLKTEHYLLKQTKDKRIYLYRKEIREKYPIQRLAMNNQNIKTKEVYQMKVITGNSLKQRIRQLKAEADKQSRNTNDKGGFFSCLPCFKK